MGDDDDLLPLLALAGTAVATGGFGLAAAGGAGAGATTAAAVYMNPFTGAAFAPSAGGLFSGITGSQILSGASLGMGLYGSMQQSAMAEKQFSLQAAQEAESTALQALDAERNLTRTLSSIRNQAGNTGTLLSDGTVQGAIQAARSVTNEQLERIGVADETQYSDLLLKKRSAQNRALGSGVGSLFDYGNRVARVG